MKKETTMSSKTHISDNHPNHEKHLCSLADRRKMKTVARLAKDAKFMCLICGRAAKSEENLCWPTEF